MRVVLLCLVLAGCAAPRIKVVCPALHPWTIDFQKQMATEIRAHRQDCPALIDEVVEISKIRAYCGTKYGSQENGK